MGVLYISSPFFVTMYDIVIGLCRIGDGEKKKKNSLGYVEHAMWFLIVG